MTIPAGTDVAQSADHLETLRQEARDEALEVLGETNEE